MVMGPEWTGMEACQTLCYGLVRISFFPTENECFHQKTLILDQHFWSFLVVFSSRPRQLTFFCLVHHFLDLFDDNLGLFWVDWSS